MPCSVPDLGQHWFRLWLVAWLHQQLPEPTLTVQLWESMAFFWEWFTGNEMSITGWDWYFKITATSPREKWVKLMVYQWLWRSETSSGVKIPNYYTVWSLTLAADDLTVISDIYRSFKPNKTTFTKYCLAQWVPKLPRSVEIRWVRQYMVNFTGLAGIVNTTVYKTKPIFTGLGHSKLS